MGAIASQIIRLTIVYSTGYSRADQRKHQSSASLAFVRGIHRWPVNSPHKRPVNRKMFPFDDVIMQLLKWLRNYWNVNIYCSTVCTASNACTWCPTFCRRRAFLKWWNLSGIKVDQILFILDRFTFDYRLGLVALVPVGCQTSDKPLPVGHNKLYIYTYIHTHIKCTMSMCMCVCGKYYKYIWNGTDVVKYMLGFQGGYSVQILEGSRIRHDLTGGIVGRDDTA